MLAVVQFNLYNIYVAFFDFKKCLCFGSKWRQPHSPSPLLPSQFYVGIQGFTPRALPQSETLHDTGVDSTHFQKWGWVSSFVDLDECPIYIYQANLNDFGRTLIPFYVFLEQILLAKFGHIWWASSKCRSAQRVDLQYVRTCRPPNTEHMRREI